ncbi:hypothetical protein RJT34_28284 [Clitoria ternatea]|uniref:LOB domain-containing protein n=1 Tax=Clitoria ternatea TaxID=43366 RepID=A0AAN9I8Y7_CLITE
MENSTSRSSSSTQACAACKYQRRKCGPKCILAPYFPHDRQKQFLNAHRLFGVGKITNMIKDLNPHDRDTAVKTIIYQSDMRQKNPVGGCYQHIQELHSQIEYTRAQLHLVLQHLAFFRAQAQAQANSSHIIDPDPPQPFVDQQTSQEQQQQYFNYNILQEDMNSWVIRDSLPLSPLSLQDMTHNLVFDHGYDQKPVLDLMNKMNLDLAPSISPPDEVRMYPYIMC